MAFCKEITLWNDYLDKKLTVLSATVASIIRLTQLHNLGSVDFSYACVSSLNWSVVEVGTGIICASVPSMKPILKHLYPRRFLSQPSGISARNPTIGHVVTREIGRDKYGLEMSTRTQETSSQHTSLELSTQVATSISTASNHRMESDEESLVSAGPNQKLSRSIVG